MGRIVQITDPLNRSVSLAYNADDWLVSRTRADGRLILYEYDAVGRPTQTLYPDAHVVARLYDADGRLVSLDDGSWKALYTYDDAGRLTQTALPTQDLTLTYGYDPAGNRLALQARQASTLLYTTPLGLRRSGAGDDRNRCHQRLCHHVYIQRRPDRQDAGALVRRARDYILRRGGPCNAH